MRQEVGVGLKRPIAQHQVHRFDVGLIVVDENGSIWRVAKQEGQTVSIFRAEPTQRFPACKPCHEGIHLQHTERFWDEGDDMFAPQELGCRCSCPLESIRTMTSTLLAWNLDKGHWQVAT